MKSVTEAIARSLAESLRELGHQVEFVGVGYNGPVIVWLGSGYHNERYKRQIYVTDKYFISYITNTPSPNYYELNDSQFLEKIVRPWISVLYRNHLPAR